MYNLFYTELEFIFFHAHCLYYCPEKKELPREQLFFPLG